MQSDTIGHMLSFVLISPGGLAGLGIPIDGKRRHRWIGQSPQQPSDVHLNATHYATNTPHLLVQCRRSGLRMWRWSFRTGLQLDLHAF